MIQQVQEFMFRRRPSRLVVSQHGAAIRELRRKAGLTVDRLASKVGISGSHLRNIENEHRAASVEHIRLIAHVLKIPISAIIGEKTRESTSLCISCSMGRAAAASNRNEAALAAQKVSSIV